MARAQEAAALTLIRLYAVLMNRNGRLSYLKFHESEASLIEFEARGKAPPPCQL
jgi:hypothetical protein